VPGDEIVGFVTRGRGLSIHRADCVNVKNLSEEDRARVMAADWSEEAINASGESFVTEINIYARDRKSLLVDISRILSEADINILRISSVTSKQGIATITISFEVSSRKELQDIVGKLQNVRDVQTVTRTNG
jgi:GTP pyrophosphokinase